MSIGEFQLIHRFFERTPDSEHVSLGVGDDAALVSVPPGCELAVAIDTLVAGVHFPVDTAPGDIGHKALAVNLSDLAAMGAEPVWATLALTLPESDESWLRAFASGFFELADVHGVSLIGGDTTHGPLTVTVQVAGHVPVGAALRRRGAREADQIWVTGTLGDAALALKHELGRTVLAADTYQTLARRLHRPTPRLSVGRALRGVATAAIDISDGLCADLGHILTASHIGATIFTERLPLSDAVRGYLADNAEWQLPLAGGDDYELCFTAPSDKSDVIKNMAAKLAVRCTCIGHIEEHIGLRCVSIDGGTFEPEAPGYDHFPDGAP